jgi:hypothetical protein
VLQLRRGAASSGHRKSLRQKSQGQPPQMHPKRKGDSNRFHALDIKTYCWLYIYKIGKRDFIKPLDFLEFFI